MKQQFEIDKKHKRNPPESLVDESLKPFMYHGEDYETHGHIMFRFPNGYGASILHGRGTHGLEMVKIIFIDESDEYDIRQEPWGYLEKEKMNELLHQIKNGD